MLKLQCPTDFNSYIGVDPKRCNELHKLGFIPEYLYNNVLFFRKTDKLIDYLKNGKTLDKDIPKINTPKSNVKFEKQPKKKVKKMVVEE